MRVKILNDGVLTVFEVGYLFDRDPNFQLAVGLVKRLGKPVAFKDRLDDQWHHWSSECYHDPVSAELVKQYEALGLLGD